MVTLSETPSDVQAPFAWTPDRPLLAAEWRHLAMLNYEIDPKVLAPHVPAGTELDYWNGATYVSLVGFQFLRTRFLGVAVPLHVNFVEVNLRFYVQRRAAEGWRRGVVFIRELAPRRAVAIIANLLYGERYLTVPMTSRVEFDGDVTAGDGVPRRVEYGWRHKGRPGSVAVETDGPARLPEPGSHEQYIVEHYWGYSALRLGRAKEYLVAHPPWRICPAASAAFDGDAKRIYGESFAECLNQPPVSAFWADGSPVRVHRGKRI
jgi:uncharacterized protein YqjF (DUF2071 family)